MDIEARYQSFIYRLETTGAEPLTSYTIALWTRYFLENQIDFVKFVRKSDESIWMSTPTNSSHVFLKNNAGDPRASVKDAGSISFRQPEDCLKISVYDDSGSLNIGKDEREREQTVLIVGKFVEALICCSVLSGV